MAITTLYTPDMDTLKKRLRLSGVSQEDPTAMIEAAVQQARQRIFSLLGSTRAVAITAFAYEENPTSDNGILRLKACDLELALVKQNLLRALPTLFFDNSQPKEVWNDEGMARRTNERYIESELARLDSDISTLIGELAEPADPDAKSSFRIKTLAPAACKVTSPGQSVWGPPREY